MASEGHLSLYVFFKEGSHPVRNIPVPSSKMSCRFEIHWVILALLALNTDASNNILSESFYQARLESAQWNKMDPIVCQFSFVLLHYAIFLTHRRNPCL